MMWAMVNKKPTWLSFVGIGMGMFGVYLLVSQNEIIASSDQWLATAVVFSCLFVWGFASIYVGRADLPKSFIVNTAFQMLSGGVTCLIASSVMEDLALDWASISNFTWFAMSYLIVLGAALVFIAFNYLLKNVSPEKVATATYVHPVIALLLGWYFRDELVTSQSIIAAAIMLTGVFFINVELELVKKWLKSFQRYFRSLKAKRA